MEGNPLSCIDSIQVNVEGVVDLLSNIVSSKAHGPDNLPAHFLKEVSFEIAPTLPGITGPGHLAKSLEASHSCSCF